MRGIKWQKSIQTRKAGRKVGNHIADSLKIRVVA